MAAMMLAAITLGIPAWAAEDPPKTEHPLKKADVGDWIKFKASAIEGTGADEAEDEFKKIILAAREGNKAVLVTEEPRFERIAVPTDLGTVEVSHAQIVGRFIQRFNLDEEFDAVAALVGESLGDFEKIGEGRETITVMGMELECDWISYATKKDEDDIRNMSSERPKPAWAAEHPLKQAEVGDWIVYKTDDRLPTLEFEGTETVILAAREGNKAVLVFESRMKREGRGDALLGRYKEKVDLDAEFDPAKWATDGLSKFAEKTGEGRETLALLDREFECDWISYAVEEDGDTVVEMKVWFTPELMLGVAKSELAVLEGRTSKSYVVETGKGAAVDDLKDIDWGDEDWEWGVEVKAWFTPELMLGVAKMVV